jgi:exopolysaccharide biosynthesis polyprenyl glycosylphosphotransferase
MKEHRTHLGGQVVWMALLDALCLVAGIVLSIVVRLGSEAVREYFFENIYGWIYYAGSVILANYIVGSYGIQTKVSRFNLLVNWAFSVIVALLVVSITSFAWFQMFLGRGVLGIAIAIYSVLWLTCGLILYRYVLRAPAFAHRIAILGSGAAAAEIGRVVTDAAIRPVHRVVAFLRPAGEAGAAAAIDGVLVAGCHSTNLVETVRGLNVSAVIISHDVPEAALAELYSALRRLRFEHVVVLDPLHVAEIYLGRIPLELVNEQWLTQATAEMSSPAVMRLKSVVNFLLAAVALLVLLPVWILVALLLKLSAWRSPVFYSQQRVGRFGGLFTMYKFRTMIDAAEAEGPVWSPPNDRRITRIGRVLRKFRFDELPQLANVLRGEMSLVGPRPERPELVAELEKVIPFYRERENVLPGMTGWAQIRYPYGATVEDTRRKLEYDLYYIKNLSLTLDLRILLRTFRIVFLGLERKNP